MAKMYAGSLYDRAPEPSMEEGPKSSILLQCITERLDLQPDQTLDFQGLDSLGLLEAELDIIEVAEQYFLRLIEINSHKLHEILLGILENASSKPIDLADAVYDHCYALMLSASG